MLHTKNWKRSTKVNWSFANFGVLLIKMKTIQPDRMFNVFVVYSSNLSKKAIIENRNYNAKKHKLP